MKKTKKRQLGNGGFSLVELIIVIAIMAILAAAIGPALVRYIQKSREARAISEAEALVNATQTGLADISSLDLDFNLSRAFTKSNGNTVRCGIITNSMLKQAQGSTPVPQGDPDYSDYVLAGAILENLNTGSRSDFQFKNYSGSGSSPIGEALSSYGGNSKHCPGVIIVFNDHEQVIMLEYYKNDILIHYEDGEYKVSKESSFTGTDRITY